MSGLGLGLGSISDSSHARAQSLAWQATHAQARSPAQAQYMPQSHFRALVLAETKFQASM